MNTLTETVFSDVVNFTEDPHLSKEVKDFLKKLNVSSLETLNPIQVRGLANTQASSMPLYQYRSKRSQVKAIR